ncbi:MAG: hypothetical protein JKY61_07170 [Planctomycetes bacterium]|nr:hypothetical protein [Planctomycetota bacterium]
MSGLSRVNVPIPPSLIEGAICVAGPYSLGPDCEELLDLVGEAALVKMTKNKGYDETRYLFHIDASGGVDYVPIDWPVFIGKHYEKRLVGGEVLVLLLDGLELVGIDTE